ncbi:uncharacterized protein LOC119600307 [Lucilia sericata]|uniref:uncharacterized protein LOC119600307 n=1 Tax=Lucilia sericata TaxID=13632 RepID=UPI0018A7ECAA|nr:uncharacterized protein LOC119600307 [Lucilia sericata]
MKFFIVLSLILSVFSLTFADESAGFFTDPAHPGKCVYEDVILSPGEEAKLPGQCARFSCGENSFATIQGCGVMLPPPGCHYGDFIDSSAPYSDCCEKELICS